MNRSVRPLFPNDPTTMLMNVLRLIVCSACLASAAVMAQPAATERVPQNVSLLTGAQQTLNLGRPLERVAIGNPEVADALLLKTGGVTNSLLLVGKKTGDTSVIVWPRGGAPLHYQVRVDGAAPIAVSNTVQVDVKVVEFSKTVLKEAGFNLFLSRSGFAFGSFAPGSLRSYEMSGAPARRPSLSVDTTSPISSAFNLVAGISGGIFSNLSLLEANGMARVLAEPTLVALSGQNATFLAGGEIPIPVPQAFGTTTIEYKQFGIGLTVTPTVLAPNRIALKVAPEASDLDATRGIVLNGASVPAIITRRADTTVELGDGESFIIGGLVSRNTLSNVDKVPLLGDLPIIGTFFKRLNFHQEDRELMIVVTPHLVKPIARDAPVLRALPGEGKTVAEPWTWRTFVLGGAAQEAAPGFSR